MLPGIIINESLGTKAYGDGKIKKDDIMSVNLDNNKACVAVGTSALSSEDMYMSGKRGKALNRRILRDLAKIDFMYEKLFLYTHATTNLWSSWSKRFAAFALRNV